MRVVGAVQENPSYIFAMRDEGLNWRSSCEVEMMCVCVCVLVFILFLETLWIFLLNRSGLYVP